jgi:endonuclease-8
MSGSWTISTAGRRLPPAVMPDVRVVLRTDGPAAYGVRLPVVDLVRTRDEACVVGHLGRRKDWDVGEAVRRMSIEPGPALATGLGQDQAGG